MAKRSRDAQGALPPPQKSRHQKPTGPVRGGGATEKARGSVEEGRPVAPGTSAFAGDCLLKQGVAGEGMESHAPCDAGSAAGGLPRWWQLWVGTGGGTVVDCEELLCGRFPFVDEDFSCDGGKVGCLSCWGDGQVDVFYDDIWQLKHINEIPSPPK